jgi:phosphatidate cytidylyltransferase
VLDRRQMSAPNARTQVLVSSAIGAVAIGALVAGRLAVSVFAALVLVVAYVDLRRLLAERGHLLTFVLGAAGVGAFLWCGYRGDLALLPAFGAGLVLALLVSRVFLNEAGVQASGVTGDLAATLGAAGTIGILGAHVLLVRAVPRFGLRGLIALGGMVIANDVIAFFVGRIRGRHPLNKLVSPSKTWEGALAGFAASVVVGAVVGLVFDPPFDLSSGLAFGAGVGILTPIGDLAFSTIKRSAGVKHSGGYLGAAGGALDVADSMVFVAPAFYWAFRTIAI